MSYRFEITKSTEPEVHRVVLEQIDKALAEIRNEALDQPETIHQVRKRCKKIRAVLRLVRASLSDPKTYRFENAYFRDAARSLSALRDVEALIESFDKLMDTSAHNADQSRFRDIRRELVHHRELLGQQTNDQSNKLNAFYEKMIGARKRIKSWQLTVDGPEAVASGLKQTYRRGGRAMGAAYENPSCESFHEWRKRVKYHWYHCRLLHGVWKPVMKARIGELDKLATLLGDYHDLDVLCPRIEHLSSRLVDSNAMCRLRQIIEQRQKEIRSDANLYGKKLFAEKSKHLCRRFKHYWNAFSRRHTDFQSESSVCKSL